MTKGIGWDIGIKNLAYCILDSGIPIEKSSIDTICFNSTYYNIVNWKDISLVAQIESNLGDTGEVSHINNSLKCSAINETATKKANKKAGKQKNNTENNTLQQEPLPDSICGKSALYCKEEVITNSFGNISYLGLCKTHYKKCGIVPLPELSVKQCWHTDCNAKPIQVLKAHIYKGYCKKHINDMIKQKTHLTTDFLKINRAKTTSKFDINQLGMALFQELDKIKSTILDASHILLENQPVLKNPTMKSIQMFLYSYYLLRIMDTTMDTTMDTHSSERSGNSSVSNSILNKKIQCYCASKKLDLILFLSEVDQKRILDIIDKVNSDYQKNKKMAIMMVETLLQNNLKWLTFFKGHPKQDDLADSLLMTLHYFEKGNLMKMKSDDKKKDKKVNKIKDKKNKEEVEDLDLDLDLDLVN
jgi:hypothetical protein